MTHRVLAATTALALLFAGCGRRTVAIAPPVAPVPPESLYSQGLKAFHEGTPESYARAADAFRAAWKAKPERCEYPLNLAQTLVFLAKEQSLNREEFMPRETEARSIVDSLEAQCLPIHEPFVLRLRAFIAGRGPAAAEAINRSVDLDPTDAMNWLVLGYLDPGSRHVMTERGFARWIAMERAVERLPESALFQYELGKNYPPGSSSTGKQALGRAVTLSPRHFRGYLGLAYLADENEDVESLFRKVVEIAPNFLEGRIAMGDYHSGLEETDNAAEQYAAAIAANAAYDTAHFRFGLLMLQVERPAEAEKHFKRVIELNTQSPEAYYHLGNILYGRKQFDEAKKQYDEAVKIRLNYAEAEYGIGWVYRQQDQTDLAVAQFDKVIKIQPRYGDAYLSRGDIRAERRQLPEALADYEKAIEVYEAQLKGLNATIEFAETRSQSRAMQAEKRRAERDKKRIEAVLQRAREYKSEILKLTPETPSNEVR